MKISAGRTVREPGWTGREIDLVPDAPGHPARTLRILLPDAYADWISDRLEAPVLAALFPAMAIGEPIRVEGPLSAVFHYQVRQVMKYFHLWYPRELTLVDVLCDGFDEALPRGNATCACFSGGVDSFYTLWHHRAESEPIPRYRITHGLFAHGFDIPLDRAEYYERQAASYEAMLDELGIRLVRMRTNVREILDPCASWMTTHGAALQMAAHFLASGMRTFLIPSTNRFSLINPPIGSNPITDPQPGSEALEIVHHGCEASRIQKLLTIADWAPARKHLRVCFQDKTEVLNCGACKKCHKVMLPLWVAGKLESFETFPPGFDPARIDPLCFKGTDPAHYPQELSYGDELKELAARLRPDALSGIPFPQPAPDPARPSRGWRGWRGGPWRVR